MEILPKDKKGTDVELEIGMEWPCPFCVAQMTSDEADTGWVECPIRQRKPKWICLGCCIDIATMCRSESFHNPLYSEIVTKAAENERISTTEARRTCLRHQLEILEEDIREKPDNKESLRMRNGIRRLLEEVDKAT